MKKYAALVLAVLLTAGLAAQVSAAPPKRTPGTPRPHLTQAQIDQIKAERQSAQAAMAPQRAQMNSLTDQLRTELHKKPVDKNKVDSLMRQIDAVRGDMEVQQMQSMMKSRPNMTPADKQRYNGLMQKLKDRQTKLQQAQ